MRHKQRNRTSARFWFIVSAVLIAPVIILILYRMSLQSEFDRRVEALRAEGFPVSIEDLQQRYALSEGTENAAEIYILAFKYLQAPNSEEIPFLPISGSFRWSQLQPPYPQQVTDAVESYLQRNQSTLDLLDQAAQTEHCAWPRTIEGCWMINKYVSEVKRAGQLLYTRNIYLTQAGNREELYKAMLASIAISRSSSRQPILNDHLTGTSLKALCINSLSTVLAQADFTEDQLETLQKHFATMHDDKALYRALIRERCFTIGFWKLPPAKQSENSFRKDPKAVQLLYSTSGLKQQDALLSLDYMEINLETAKLPTHERQAAFEKNKSEINTGILSFMRLYLENNTLTPENVNAIDLRTIANLKCAETALAIERYRKKFHKIPYTLNDLVPRFMDHLPRDPYDNQTIRYKRISNGYKLYTIGKDGIDNGGVSRKIAKEKFGYDTQKYDLTFTIQWKQHHSK